MADKTHLEIINDGVKAWNIWRTSNPQLRPDLCGADLSNKDLRRVDLSGALLREADLSGCNLELANFGPAYFDDEYAWRATRLESANLEGANLTQAYFVANFYKTNLSSALCKYTRFVDIHNISDAIGLDNIIYGGPCSISIDTIISGGGRIPDHFFRGCGYSETIQDNVLTGGRIEEKHIVRLRSCFVSYSTQDKEFVSNLIRRLNELKVDYWYDAEHLIDGEGIKEQIQYGISSKDRVILVVSKSSINSRWVNMELEKALKEEEARKKVKEKGWRVLFPVMIDEAFNDSDDHDIAWLRKDRRASDFRNALEGMKFEEALKRLIQGLRNEVAF